MKYYKHPESSEVFAYESEQERQEWGAPELVEMTPEEVEAHLNPPPTPLTDEQLASMERVWRNGELDRADIELNKVQDGMGFGSVSEWREYRKALRDWPEHPDFPNKEFRPKAPDYKE